MTVLTSDQDTILVETPKTLTVVSENVLSQVVEKPENFVVSVVENTTLYHTTSYIEEVVVGGIQGPPGIPGASTQFEYHPAAEVLGGDRAVTLNAAGSAVYPDLTDPNSYIVGITTQSAVLGELVEIQITGTHTEYSWSWIPGQSVFVATNGVLTQTPPTTGQVISIGVAATSNKVFIDKQPPIYIG